MLFKNNYLNIQPETHPQNANPSIQMHELNHKPFIVNAYLPIELMPVILLIVND